MMEKTTMSALTTSINTVLKVLVKAIRQGREILKRYLQRNGRSKTISIADDFILYIENPMVPVKNY